MLCCAGLCEHERLRLQTEDIVWNSVLGHWIYYPLKPQHWAHGRHIKLSVANILLLALLAQHTGTHSSTQFVYYVKFEWKITINAIRRAKQRKILMAEKSKREPIWKRRRKRRGKNWADLCKRSEELLGYKDTEKEKNSNISGYDGARLRPMNKNWTITTAQEKSCSLLKCSTT